MLGKRAFGELEHQSVGPARRSLQEAGEDARELGVLQAGVGQVDGQRQIPPLGPPDALLLQRQAQHPQRQRQDQTGLVREAQEALGRHLAMLRMLPARQRFHPDQPPGLERQFGQELDGQQVVFDRRPQVVAQLVLGIVLPVRRLVICDHSPLRAARPQHRRFGALDQGMLVVAVLGIDRNADVDREIHLETLHRKRLSRQLGDAPGRAGGLLRTGKAGHQQTELRVAEPGERVRSAQALLDPPDQETDQLVGERLTQACRRSA